MLVAGDASAPDNTLSGQVAGPLVMAVAADAVVPRAASATVSPEGLDARPRLEVAGVPVDVAKLLARRDFLFPFMTLDALLLAPGDRRPSDADMTLRNPIASPSEIGRAHV